MVAHADASLGDDWAAIKKNAGDAYKADHPDDSLAKLASAKAIYESSFASAAQMHNPETHDVIMDVMLNLKHYTIPASLQIRNKQNYGFNVSKNLSTLLEWL